MKLGDLLSPEQYAIKSMENLNLVLSITDSERESVNMAIKALEKQIPKKPIIQKMQIKDCIDQIQIFNKKICPSCGTVLCADWNFCFECGQKLDWGD